MPEGRGFVFRFRSTVSTRVLHFKKNVGIFQFFLDVCMLGEQYVHVLPDIFCHMYTLRCVFWDAQPWATLVGMNHLSCSAAYSIPFFNLSSLCLLSPYSLYLRSSRVTHCFHRMTNFAWTRPSASPAIVAEVA